MNPDLERLLEALDALESGEGQDFQELEAAFNSLLDSALENRPGLSRSSFLKALKLRHKAYLRSKQQPPTMPPQA